MPSPKDKKGNSRTKEEGWRGGRSEQPREGRAHHMPGPSAQTALHLWHALACHPGGLARPRSQVDPISNSLSRPLVTRKACRQARPILTLLLGSGGLTSDQHDNGRERCSVLDVNINICTLAFQNLDTITAHVRRRTSNHHTSHHRSQPGCLLPGTPRPPVSHPAPT